MPTNVITIPGAGKAVIETRDRPCVGCGKPSTRLCDTKVSGRKTCSAAICDACTFSPRVGVDYCPKHRKEPTPPEQLETKLKESIATISKSVCSGCGEPRPCWCDELEKLEAKAEKPPRVFYAPTFCVGCGCDRPCRCDAAEDEFDARHEEGERGPRGKVPR